MPYVFFFMCPRIPRGARYAKVYRISIDSLCITALRFWRQLYIDFTQLISLEVRERQ